MLGQRPKRLARSRRKTQNTLKAQGATATPQTVDFTTPNVTVTFDMPVVLNGTPTWLTNTGKRPISATIAADRLSVTAVYETPGSVTNITIDENDPAIHSRSGGPVSPGTFPAA